MRQHKYFKFTVDAAALAPFLTMVFLWVAITASQAQTAYPMLMSSFPTGAQRGKTTLVAVNIGTSNGGGATNLYGTYKAIFEGAGVIAEVVPPEKGWPALDPKKPFVIPAINSVTLKLTIAPDAPLGVREFRLATPYQGISTVGQIVIGDEPELMEAEPNNTREQAQSLTIPCVLNGKLQQAEDVDFYKFKVEAGQQVTFTMNCARLQDKIHDIAPHADPLIILSDQTGRELSRNDDYYRADPLLNYKFEKAGEYLIQVRDVNYQGNPHWAYRLNVTSRPFVTSLIPCAFRVGMNQEVKVEGFGLGGSSTAKVDVPANIPPGIWQTSLKLPNGTSNVVNLLITDTTQVSFDAKATTGNKTVTAALSAPSPKAEKGTLTLPGGVNSLLAVEGRIDRYVFKAKKGDPWGFEVTARRIDSELDSEIKVLDSKGNVLASNDDAIGKDSRIDWTTPADGDYFLDIRDLTGHGGPNYYYNLTAKPLKPDFTAKCDTDRAMIAPGNKTCWFILLDRKYGFAGEVKVDASGLPAGVTASPLTIPPELTQGVLVLSAAPDAKIDFTTVQITASGMLPGIDGKPALVTKRATPITEIYMPGGGRGQIEVKTQGVGVTEKNDIEVIVANPNVTIMPGQTIKVDVEIKRRPDYTKPVTLDLRINHLGGVFTNPLPAGITVDDGATIPENQTKGQITLHASADAKPISNLPLAIMANVSINFVMKVWFAAPIILTVKK